MLMESFNQVLADASSVFSGRRDRSDRDWARLGSDRGVVPLNARYCRPGPQLADEIAAAVLSNVVLNVVGEPGVGKTFTIRQVLQQLFDSKLISGFSVFTPTGSTSPDDFFMDSTIFSVEQGQQRVRMQPSFFGAVMDRIAENLSSGTGGVSCFVVFIDEITRANSSVIDSLLEPLASGEYALRGTKILLDNVRFLFASNPAGMDVTSIRLPPPMTSRIHKTLRLVGSELGLLSGLYLPLAISHQLEKMNRAPHDVHRYCVSEISLSRMACLVRLLLNGLPFSRNCWTDTTPQEKRLVAKVIEAAPEIVPELLLIGKHSTWGPDARRPMAWLLSLIANAVQNSREAGEVAFVNSAINVNLHAIRTTYNDAKDAHARESVQGAIYRVAKCVVSRPAVRMILAQHEDPYSLTQKILGVDITDPRSWSSQLKEAMNQLCTVLYKVRDSLEEACGPQEADERWSQFVKVLLASTTGDIDRTMTTATEAGWIPEGVPGCIEVHALRDIRQISGTPVALVDFIIQLGVCGVGAGLNLTDCPSVGVSREGWLRDKLQNREESDAKRAEQHAWEFAPEFRRWLKEETNQISHSLITTAVSIVNGMTAGIASADSSSGSDLSGSVLNDVEALSDDDRCQVLSLLTRIRYRAKGPLRTKISALVYHFRKRHGDNTHRCPICNAVPTVGPIGPIGPICSADSGGCS